MIGIQGRLLLICLTVQGESKHPNSYSLSADTSVL